METRANYVLIGAFVLMAAAALMLFAVWISGSSLSTSHSDYDVIFEGPVNGLTEGGEVRFNGIKVGEVRQLSLDRNDPNRVIARIRVDAETPVRADSHAELNFQGVTGVTFIQIFAGTPGRPLLTRAMGAPPPIIPTKRTAIDELLSGGQDLFTSASDAVQQLKEILTPENSAAVTRILNNLDVATGKLARDGGLIDTAQETIAHANRTLANVDGAIASVNQAVGNANTQISTIGGQVSGVLNDAQPMIANANEGLASFNSTMGRLDRDLAPAATSTLRQFNNAAADLRTLILRLNTLAGEVEQDPSRFVYRQPDPVERR
jgi:phospholipid/cholesterol/gamma-HCH transport system substrate-binding protein